MIKTSLPRRTVWVATAIVALACDNATEPISVASLVVSPDPAVLLQNDTAQLHVSALDGQGRLLTGIPVTFASADTAIVAVSNTGRVTSHNLKGSTTVRVSTGHIEKQVSVVVVAPPMSIEISPADTAVLQDDSLQLTVVVRDSLGAPVPGFPVTYTGFAPGIATIDSTGFVRSLGPAGTGVFRASASGSLEVFTSVTVRDSTRISRLLLNSRPNFVAINGDIAYVTRVDSRQVQRMDLATTSFTDLVTAGLLPCGVVFNPTGTRAYVANQGDDNISVINVTTNTEIGVIPVHGDPLPVAISKDGTTLFVTTNVDRLFKINIATSTVLDSIDLPATSHHLLMDPNDSLLYVATRDGGTVMAVRWRPMTVARTYTLGVQTLGMELAPDRSELYVTTNSNDSLYIVNLATGARSTAPVGGGASTIAMNPDGSRLYVGLLFSGKIEVLNRVTRAHIKTIRTGGVVREMAVDTPRNRIVVTNEDGWVDIVR